MRIVGLFSLGLGADLALSLGLMLFRGGVVGMSSSPLSSSVPGITERQYFQRLCDGLMYWSLEQLEFKKRLLDQWNFLNQACLLLPFQ